MKGFQLLEKIKKQNKTAKDSVSAFLKKPNQLRQNIFLLFPPAFLLLSFLILNLLNTELKNLTLSRSLQTYSFATPSPAPYPLANNVLSIVDQKISISEQKPESQIKDFLDISANGAIAIDDSSKVVLYAKNENLRFSTASTAKIMTALVSLDYFNLRDILIVKDNLAEGSIVGFEKGERLYFEDLLYALLLPSSNDAAYTIAQNFPGGETEFIKKMNEKAKSLHLYNTYFSDPAGLLDDGDYTSVLDLAMLASTSIKNEKFSAIVSTKHKVISNVEEDKKYEIYNLNKLLGINGIDGVKTGLTEGARGVLVTSKIDERQDGRHRLIVVVMKSEDRFQDTEEILNFISKSSISYKNF